MSNGELKHNLNIYLYSFEEILGLFDLPFAITLEDLKRAKKKVLMTHPDKSNLSPDYFLFYKKAFDIVLNYYEQQNKQNKPVPKEEIPYDSSNVNKFNRSTEQKISAAINGLKPQVFHEQFNQLFEKNMVKKPNPEKNEWFHKDEPAYQIDKNISKSNMNEVMEKMKNGHQHIVKYNGVQSFYSSGNGTGFYDDDEESEDYVTSDPFSKLKFDDLRKVHKDQTIFAVKETDFNNVPKYKSMDQYNRERGKQDLTPLEKAESERILAEQQRIHNERISQKQYQNHLRTQQYEEKNKSVLSAFLHLQN